MITPEFIKYVKQKLAIGFSKEDIAKVIIKNGWTSEDLDEACNAISKNLPNMPTSLINQEVKSAPNRTGRKLTISIGLILASVIYAFYQNAIPVSSVTAYDKSATNPSEGVASLQSAPLPETLPVAAPTETSPSKKITPTAKTPAPVPKPVIKPVPVPAPVVKKPLGQYADGTYIGDPADAYYGTIQVAAIIKNGVLADVQFLQHPSDRNTSVRINNRAMPILRQEAISAQSGNVNIVSGATDSSQAFQLSMSSALAQAKN